VAISIIGKASGLVDSTTLGFVQHLSVQVALLTEIKLPKLGCGHRWEGIRESARVERE